MVQTRAEPLGLDLVVGPPDAADFSSGEYCGVLLQYPDTHGRLVDPRETIAAAREAGALAIVASDLLALTIATPPGEFGADIVIGNSQRFGVSLGLGGPHAAFLSTHDKYRRLMPGRIVGVSKDAHGGMAYRLALQTREQHIRRESATSNICTAQVLLAIMASMYAVYHGPDGLRRIGERVHGLTGVLAAALKELGFALGDEAFFDTLHVVTDQADAIYQRAQAARINLRRFGSDAIGIALDEKSDLREVQTLIEIFANGSAAPQAADHLRATSLPETLAALRHILSTVFSSYHAEHEMLRYLNRLQSKDLSLTTSMIPWVHAR